MNRESRKLIKSVLVLLCLVTMVVCTACTTTRPGMVSETPAQKFSGTDMQKSFCRGCTNILLCWLEIPHEMEARVRGNRGDEPYSFIFSLVDLPIGAVSGAYATTDRALNGVVEILMSPVLHSPVNTPEWPAYFWSGSERNERNNGSYGTLSNGKSQRERNGLPARSGDLNGEWAIERQAADHY